MCLKFEVSETDSFFDIEANVNMLYAHVIWPKSGQVIDSSKTAQIPQVPKAFNSTGLYYSRIRNITLFLKSLI